MAVVALSGFMACGKSFFGAAAASSLGWRFIDLDKEITSRFGSVASIFSRGGQEEFRKCEAVVLEEVVGGIGKDSRTLLSLGGGTVLSAANVDILHRHGVRILWLDTSMDIIWREMGNSVRPLAKGKSRREMEALLEERRPSYEASADSVFKVDTDDYDEVIEKLAHKIEDMV